MRRPCAAAKASACSASTVGPGQPGLHQPSGSMRAPRRSAPSSRVRRRRAPAEVGSAQVAAPQVGLDQVGLAQPQPGQVGLAQIGPAQRGQREVAVGEHDRAQPAVHHAGAEQRAAAERASRPASPGAGCRCGSAAPRWVESPRSAPVKSHSSNEHDSVTRPRRSASTNRQRTKRRRRHGLAPGRAARTGRDRCTPVSSASSTPAAALMRALGDEPVDDLVAEPELGERGQCGHREVAEHALHLGVAQDAGAAAVGVVPMAARSARSPSGSASHSSSVDIPVERPVRRAWPRS